MQLAQLFLVLYGIFALVTPVLVIVLLVRYGKLREQLKRNEEENARQAKSFEREIAELRRQVAAPRLAATEQAAATESVKPTPVSVPASPAAKLPAPPPIPAPVPVAAKPPAPVVLPPPVAIPPKPPVPAEAHPVAPAEQKPLVPAAASVPVAPASAEPKTRIPETKIPVAAAISEDAAASARVIASPAFQGLRVPASSTPPAPTPSREVSFTLGKYRRKCGFRIDGAAAKAAPGRRTLN